METVILIRAIFLLVEAIIRIRGKQFPKKELNFASGQLIFWLANFSLHFLGTCANDSFLSI